MLVDRSIRLPIGILEDFPLKVGDCLISTNFVVLQMDEKLTDPIILRRPFLATARAIIDVRKGMIDLHLGAYVLKFDINKVMKKPTIEEQVFYIETLEDLVYEYMEVLNMENPLEIALTI